MGCGCNLRGKTENETLKNELKWMAGWTLKMMRIMKAQHSILSHIASMHSMSHSGHSADPCEDLDVMSAMANGGCNLSNSFELGIYNAKEPPVYESLIRSFTEMSEQGKGNIPVPFDPYISDLKSEIEVVDADKAAFKTQFCTMMHAYSELATLIKKYYTKKYPDISSKKEFVPQLQIKLRLLDEYGYDANPTEFDLMGMITAYNTAAGGSKPVDDASASEEVRKS